MFQDCSRCDEGVGWAWGSVRRVSRFREDLVDFSFSDKPEAHLLARQDKEQPQCSLELL